jgi:hypothetical protein
MKGKPREWEPASGASEQRVLEALKRRERRRWRASGCAALLALLVAPLTHAGHRPAALAPSSLPPDPFPPGHLLTGKRPQAPCARAPSVRHTPYSGGGGCRGVGPLRGRDACGAATQHSLTLQPLPSMQCSWRHGHR